LGEWKELRGWRSGRRSGRTHEEKDHVFTARPGDRVGE
jgi:hypothetical protein